jgi:hypothetical protein
MTVSRKTATVAAARNGRENRSNFFAGGGSADVLRRKSGKPSFFTGGVDGKSSLIQLSPLSEQTEKAWKDGHDKGKIFDLLRANKPEDAKTDVDLKQCLDRLFSGQPDDLWLAQAIRENGPEPLWPGELIAERHRRAVAGKWAEEPGHIAGQLGVSAKGQAIHSYFFPGKTDNRALIIGGVHGSELVGIEVVETLLQRLTTGPRPYYSVIIVPSLFPDNADVARASPKKINTKENIGRNTIGADKKKKKDPNREFPGPGKPYDPANPQDANKDAIEPENKMLLELINRFRPARIATVHSNRDLVNGGIYADPRADAERKAWGFDTDEDLALTMARHAAGKGANLPGNQLKDAPPKKLSEKRRRKHRSGPSGFYPTDAEKINIADAGEEQKRIFDKGFSLGGWGSTAICDKANPAANRPAMRVITIEMPEAFRVEDKSKAEQAARQAEVEAVASALREIFLGDTDVEKQGEMDPCAKATAKSP